jgi:hypothetical protein
MIDKILQTLSLPQNADLLTAILSHSGNFPFGWGDFNEEQAARLMMMTLDSDGMYHSTWLDEAREKLVSASELPMRQVSNEH